MIGWWNLTSFKSVRSRLLALMAFIVIPLAGLSIALAWANYRTVVRSIESIRDPDAFKLRSPCSHLFRGSLRTLVATVLAVDVGSAEDCAIVLRETLAGLPGNRAISIRLPGRSDCSASLFPGITESMLSDLMGRQKSLPFVQPWAGPDFAPARYDTVRVGEILHLLIFAKSADNEGRRWEAILLLDPTLLDRAFEFGSVDGTTAIALMTRGKNVVVSRNVGESEVAWLPREERARSRDHALARRIRRWNAPRLRQPDRRPPRSLRAGAIRCGGVETRRGSSC